MEPSFYNAFMEAFMHPSCEWLRFFLLSLIFLLLFYFPTEKKMENQKHKTWNA